MNTDNKSTYISEREKHSRPDVHRYRKNTTDSERQVYDPKFYRAKTRKLLIKGLWGFAGGFLFAIITTWGEKDFMIGFPFLLGFFFAGIPFGREILGRTLGHWYAIGSLPVMILVPVFQLIGAILIGWIAYPIALLYNLMKAQAQGSTAGKVYKVLLITVIVLMTVLLALACWPRK